MERKESIALGDAMRQFIEQSCMQERLEEMRAAEKWPLVIGADIASMSPRPFVRAGVMTVRLTNAALRQELHLNRSALRDALNKIVGKPIIKEIRFTS